MNTPRYTYVCVVAFLFLTLPARSQSRQDDSVRFSISFIPEFFWPISYDDPHDRLVNHFGLRTTFPYSWKPFAEMGVVFTKNDQAYRSKPGFWVGTGMSFVVAPKWDILGKITYTHVKFEREWLALDPDQGGTSISHDRAQLDRLGFRAEIRYWLLPDAFPQLALSTGAGWNLSDNQIDFNDLGEIRKENTTTSFASIQFGLVLMYSRKR